MIKYIYIVLSFFSLSYQVNSADHWFPPENETEKAIDGNFEAEKYLVSMDSASATYFSGGCCWSVDVWRSASMVTVSAFKMAILLG